MTATSHSFMLTAVCATILMYHNNEKKMFLNYSQDCDTVVVEYNVK